MPDTTSNNANRFRLATEDDDQVLRAKKTTEQLYKLSQQELKERMEAGESTAETLGSQFNEGMRNPVLSTGLRGLQAAGVDTNKLRDYMPPGIPADPDELNRLNQVRQQAVNQSGIYPEGFAGDIAQGAMSAAQQVPMMFGAGAAGGLAGGPVGAFAGMTGSFAAQAWNDAYTEAIDQGFDEGRAKEYANIAAANEAVVTTAFQAVGLGGVEKAIAGGITSSVRRQLSKNILQKAANAAGTFGKSLSQEMTEEITIESINNLARAMKGVDPDATDMDRMVETAVDTAIQTFWTQLFVGGSQGAGRAIEDYTANNPLGRKQTKQDESQVPPELQEAQDDLFPEGQPTDGEEGGNTVPDDGQGVTPDFSTAEAIEEEYNKQIEQLDAFRDKAIQDGVDPDKVQERYEQFKERIDAWRQQNLDRIAGGEEVEGEPEGPAPEPEGPAPEPEGPAPEPVVPDPTAPDAEGTQTPDPAPSTEDLAGAIDDALAEDDDSPPEPSQEQENDSYSNVEDKDFLEQRLQEALDAEEMARNILQDSQARPEEVEFAETLLRDSLRTSAAIKARLVELGEGLPEDEMSELELLAQELQGAADQIESAESPVDKQAEGLGLQRLTWDADRINEETGEFDTQIGQSNAVNIGGSSVVQMNINGVNIPFVQPKDSVELPDVEAGKWYPFFGLTENGKIIEGDSVQINDYYGMPVLREAAEKLDATVGDIRNERSPAVNPTGVIADELNDGLGLEQGRPSSPAEKKNQIKDVVGRIGQKPAEEQSQEEATAEETVEAEQQVEEVEQPQEPELVQEEQQETRSPDDVVDSYATKKGFTSEEAKVEGRQQAVQNFVNDGTLPDRQSKYDDDFTAEDAANELSDDRFAENRDKVMEDFVRDGSLPKYGLGKMEQEELRGALQEIAQDDELRGALQEIADRDGIKPEEKKTLGQPVDEQPQEQPSAEDLASAIDEALDEEVEQPSEEQLQEDKDFERVDAEISEQDRQIKESLQEALQYRSFGPSYRGDINVRAERLQKAFDEQASPEQKKILHDELREFLDREAARQEGKKTLGEKPVIAPLRSWSDGKDGSYSIALTETDDGKFRVTESQAGRKPNSLDFDTREEADLEYSKSRKAAVEIKTRTALQEDDAEVALVRGSDGLATETSLELAVERHFEGKNPWQSGKPLKRDTRTSLLGLELEPLAHYAKTKLAGFYRDNMALSEKEAMRKADKVIAPWVELYQKSRKLGERHRQRYLAEAQEAERSGPIRGLPVTNSIQRLHSDIRVVLGDFIVGKTGSEVLEAGVDFDVLQDPEYSIAKREMGIETDEGSEKGKWKSTRGSLTESITTDEGAVDVTSRLNMFGTVPKSWEASATSPDGRDVVEFGSTRAEAVAKVSQDVATQRRTLEDRKSKVYTKQELDELASLPSSSLRRRELRYIAAAREIAGANTLRYKTLVEKILQQQEDAVEDEPTPELPSQSLETNGTIKEFSVEMEDEGESWNATVQFTDSMQGIKEGISKLKQEANEELANDSYFIPPFKRWTHSVAFVPDKESGENLNYEPITYHDGFPKISEILSDLAYALREKIRDGSPDQFQNEDGSITGTVEIDAALSGVINVEGGQQDWDRFDGAEITESIASFKLTPEAKETTEPDAPTPDSTKAAINAWQPSSPIEFTANTVGGPVRVVVTPTETMFQSLQSFTEAYQKEVADFEKFDGSDFNPNVTQTEYNGRLWIQSGRTDRSLPDNEDHFFGVDLWPENAQIFDYIKESIESDLADLGEYVDEDGGTAGQVYGLVEITANLSGTTDKDATNDDVVDFEDTGYEHSQTIAEYTVFLTEPAEETTDSDGSATEQSDETGEELPKADRAKFAEKRQKRVDRASNELLIAAVNREAGKIDSETDYQRFNVTDQKKNSGVRVLLSNEQKEDSSAAQTEQHAKATVYPGLNLFISEVTDQDGDRENADRIIVHIPTGLQMSTPMSLEKANLLVRTLSVLGLEVDADGSKISEDTKIVFMAFRTTDIYGALQQSAKDGKFSLMDRVNELAKPVPPRSPADFVLGRAELDFTRPATSEAKKGKRTIEALAKGEAKIPEFSFNPVFVVTPSMKLRYQNGFTFTLNPDIFQINAEELEPGMTVAINLPDIGIKYATARDVANDYLDKWQQENKEYEVAAKTPNKTGNVHGVQVSLAEPKRSSEESARRRAEAKKAGLPAGLVSIDADNLKVSEINLSKTKGFKYEVITNEPRYNFADGSTIKQFKTIKEVKEALANVVDNQSVTVEIREDEYGDRTLKVSDANRWSFTEEGAESTELGAKIAKVLNGINWTQPGQKEAEARLEKAEAAEESVKEEQSTSGLELPSRMPELREQLAGMADDKARLEHLIEVAELAKKSDKAYKDFADTIRGWGINANTTYKPETHAKLILSRVKELSRMLPRIRSAFEYVAQHVDSLVARSDYDFGEAPEALEKISAEAFNRISSALPNVGGHLVAPLSTWGAVYLEEYLRPVVAFTYAPQEVDSLFDGLDSKVRLEGGRKAKPKSFSNEEKIADEIAKRTISFDQYALDNEGQTFLDLEGEDSESLREGLIHQSNQVLVARERKEKRDQLRKDIVAALDTEPVVTDLQSLGKIDSKKFNDDDKAQLADVLATALANLTYDDLLRAIQDTVGESENYTGERYDVTGFIIDFLGDLFRDGETDALEELLGTSYRPINRRRIVLDLMNQVIPTNEEYSKFPEAQKIVFGHFQEAAAIATNIRKQQKQRLKRELKKKKGRSVQELIQDTQSQNEELAKQFKQLLKKSMFGVGVHTEAQVIAAKLAAGILKEYSLKGIDKLMTFSQYVARASELLGVDTTLKMSKYLERAWDTAKAVVQAGDEMERSRSIKMVLDGPIHPELDFAEEAEVVYEVTDYTNAESPDSFAVSGNQRDVADIKQRAKDGRATGVSVLSVKRRTRKDKKSEEKIVLPLETVRQALIKHVNVHSLPVFLDSGMFGIVQQGEVGQEPDYDEVIKYYYEFLAEIDKDKMHLVSVVAPDFLTKIKTPDGELVIGDAVKTQELQNKYRDDILFFIGSKLNADGEKSGFGANVIIPVQRKFNADGSPDTSYTLEQGSPFGDLDFEFSPNIIIGIPANAAKWENEEIVAGAKFLVKNLQGTERLRFHLLGRGAQKGKELAKMLRQVSPTIELMGDATTESNKINAGKYRPDGLSVETIDLDSSEFDNPQDAITDGLLTGDNMTNASKLREAISDFLGEPKPKAGDLSKIQQYDGIIERAVASAAEAIIERSLDDQEIYNGLVDLHQRTPSTAKVKEQQQAEMPAPVAFIAQREIDLGTRDRVYDPLARSGMMVAGLGNAILNEPAEYRAEGLAEDGQTVTNEDAQSHEPRQKYTAVVVNASGVRGRNAAVKALSGMPDNGKAVIVLDGAADQSLSARERAAFYREDATFFDTLYEGYVVTSHYVLDAGLFDGTAKPVARQVIVIDGKQASDQEAAEGDVKQSIKLPYNRSSGVATETHIKSWEELGNERLGLQRESASDDGGQGSDTAAGQGQETQQDSSSGTSQGQDGLATGQQSDDAGTVQGGVDGKDGGVSSNDETAGRSDGDNGVSSSDGSSDGRTDVSDDSATAGERGGGVSSDAESGSEVSGRGDSSVEGPSSEELGDFLNDIMDDVVSGISGEPSLEDLENTGSEIISDSGKAPVSGETKPPKPKDTTGVRPPKQGDKPKGEKTREELEQEMKDLFDEFGDNLGGTNLGMAATGLAGIASKIVIKAIELKIFDFKQAVRKWLEIVDSDKLIAMAPYIEKAWDAIQQKFKTSYPEMTTSRPVKDVIDELSRSGDQNFIDWVSSEVVETGDNVFAEQKTIADVEIAHRNIMMQGGDAVETGKLANFMALTKKEINRLLAGNEQAGVKPRTMESLTADEADAMGQQLIGNKFLDAHLNARIAELDKGKKSPKKPKKVTFDDTTEFQVPYIAKSSMDVPSIGTLVPRNQQAAVQRNLDAVEAKYGNLVEFVATELGYTPSELREENKNGETIFSAEQIDAIALAIASHKDGYAFVNGDMTGVGKGRFAAAMMIYAIMQGKRPVFVTEKVDLFSDIMRDLTDIMKNEPDDAFEPWITTAVSGDGAVDLHSAVPHRYRKRLDKQTARRHAGGMKELNKLFPDDATSWMETESKVSEGENLGRDTNGYYVTADRIHTQSAVNAKKIASSILKSIRAGQGMKVSTGQRKADGMQAQPDKIYDAIFTTYTQLQTVKKGEESWRHDFFREIAGDGFFIMDESHNAAGKQDGRTESDEGKLLRSDFALELLQIAAEKDGANAVFASATFSKTPATMALYALTGITEGMAEDTSLLSLLKKGGVPLQQVLSEMMAESGRYIRRERSFAGIEFSHPQLPIDVKQMNEISSALQQMNKLNGEVRKQMKKRLTREEIKALGTLQNVSGILWNIVNQVLFAAKAPGVAKLAIEAIARNEKPFIAVSNTLGASLERHIENLPPTDRPSVGDAMEYDMRSLFELYLERCITCVNKGDPDDESTWNTSVLTEKEIGEDAMEVYDGIQAMIKAMPSNMSASPIDLIRRDIEASGAKIREITGRTQVIDYQPDGTAVLGERPPEERGSRGKINSVKAYNDGTVECLIGNVSAAVGLSAHASKKFDNTDRRSMFVAMPIPEINQFMQMLGRINRTGQLEEKEGMPKGSNLPRFFMTVSQSPTEQRIASNQARKLASLNANVTASDETDVKTDALDVFNSIGNRIMAQYCIDEAAESEAKYGSTGFSICAMCGVEVPKTATSASPGFMNDITGKMILLPHDRQKAFWQHVDAEFTATMNTLNQTDENPLKAAFKDFNAKTLESWDIFEGDETGSAFQRPARLEKMEVEKKLSLLSSKEMQEEIDQGFSSEDPEKDRQKKRKNLIDDVQSQASQLIKSINDEEGMDPERKTQLTKEVLARVKIIRETANIITPGSTVTVNVAREDAKYKSMTGVVLRLQHKSTSKDPTKLSDFQLVIAVDNELKRVSIPFSQMQRESTSRVDVFKNRRSLKDVMKHFDDEARPSKEIRYIGTGNILAAFEDLAQGSIVFFTDQDGQVQRGVLMPRKFTPEKWQNSKPVVFKNAKDVVKFAELGGVAKSPDSHMRVHIDERGTMQIRATSSQVAKKYYEGKNAEALEKAAGAKWKKNRGRMELEVSNKTNREAAVQAILKDMTKLQTAFANDRQIARDNGFASRGRLTSASEPVTREFMQLGDDKKTLGNKSGQSSPNVRQSSINEMTTTPRSQESTATTEGKFAAKLEDLANMRLKKNAMVSPQQFRNMLGRLFGTDIGTGNYGGLVPRGRAAGLFIIREQFVKLAGSYAFDIGVTMHETAHDIDEKLGLMATLPITVEMAMVQFDYDPTELRNYEGFAEFIRMYVTMHQMPNKQVQQFPRMLTPAYRTVVDWFENDFAEMHPDIFRRIQFAQKVAHRHMNQSAMERAHMAIVSDVEGYLKEYRQSQERRWGMRRVYWKSRLLNAFAGVKMLQDERERRGGSYQDDLSANEFMEATARSSISNAERAARTGVWRIDQDGFNENLSEGIMDTLNEMTPMEYKRFGVFLHAKMTIFNPSHATGLTVEDAISELQEIAKNPALNAKFEKARTVLANFNNALIEMAMHAGYYGQNEYDAMMRDYGGDGMEYVPLIRVKPGKMGFGKMKGASTLSQGGSRIEVPRAVYFRTKKGSMDPIIHPVQATLQRAERLYSAANQTQALGLIIKDQEGIPGLGFLAKKVMAGTEKKTHLLGEVLDQLVKMNVLTSRRAAAIKTADKIRMGLPTSDQDRARMRFEYGVASDQAALAVIPSSASFIDVYRNTWPRNNEGEKIFKFIEDGEVVYYEVHELIDVALRHMTSLNRGTILRTINIFTRMLKTGATSLSSGFGLRQVFMDAETVSIQGRDVGMAKSAEGVLPLGTMRQLGKQLAASLFKNASNEMIEIYRQHGGALVNALNTDELSMRKYLEAPLKKDLGDRVRGFGENINPKVAARNAGRSISKISDMMAATVSWTDIAPRMLEFEAVLNNHGYSLGKNGKIVFSATGRETTPPRHVLLRAVNAAMDVTYNYRRMGTWTAQLEPIFPFLNASIQSGVKMTKTIGGLVVPEVVARAVGRIVNQETGNTLGGMEPVTAQQGRLAGRQYSPTKHRARAAAAVSTKLAALTMMALWDAMKDDDDDEEEATFGKYRGLTLGAKGKEYLSLPHSRDYAPLYGAAEIMADYLYFKPDMENEELGDEFYNMMAEDLSMRLPQFVTGIVGVERGLSTNQDPFFGTPIDNPYDIANNVPRHLRATSRSSYLGKQFSENTAKINQAIPLIGPTGQGWLSANQFDFVADELFGGLYSRAVVDPFEKDIPTISNMYEDGELFTVDGASKVASSLPFLRGIFKDRLNRRSIGELYDKRREYENLHQADKDSKGGFVSKSDSKWRVMTQEEKIYREFNAEYVTLMTDFSQAAKEEPDEREREKGARMMVGLAREGLGERPLDSFVSPYNLPKEQWPAYLLQRRSGGTAAKQRSVYDEMQTMIAIQLKTAEGAGQKNAEGQEDTLPERTEAAKRWVNLHKDSIAVQKVRKDGKDFKTIRVGGKSTKKKAFVWPR